MGEGYFLIDILIFGMIAAFLVYRLRSVLGRRHGEERQRPNPFAPRPDQTAGAKARDNRDNVVKLPERQRPDEARNAMEEPRPLQAGIAAVRSADPSFDEKHFLAGARAAFEMIVQAYAQGDTETLRPLLSDEVYANFAAAIRGRQQRGESLETQIVAIRDADVVEAGVEGTTALVTVKFVSDQINVTRAADGTVIEGDPQEPLEVIDIWTFARNIRSRDPNWVLVETRVPQ